MELRLAEGASLEVSICPALTYCRQTFNWSAAVQMLKKQRARGVSRKGGHFEANRDTACYAIRFPTNEELSLVLIVNGYGPEDHIRHHADDEKQLLPKAPIVTYSFGRPVTFEIRKKRTKASWKVDTEDGQRIAMMGAKFQKLFTHGIPASRGRGYRMSVTARLCRLKQTHAYTFGAMSIPIKWMSGPDDDARDHVWSFVKQCCKDALPFIEQEWEASNEPPWKRRRQ